MGNRQGHHSAPLPVSGRHRIPEFQAEPTAHSTDVAVFSATRIIRMPEERTGERQNGTLLIGDVEGSYVGG